MNNYIAISSIKIAPNRQRREFLPTELQELRESIEATGLLQAIVLRVEGSDYVLVAGERRLRAVTDLHELGGSLWHAGEHVPKGFIPFTSLGSLSPLAAWEAELEENIRRVDLTWQERALATASLLELRRAQAEDKEEAPPTIYDIAREVRDKPGVPNAALGDAYTSTRNEILVAKFLDDKEVAAAPSLKEAFKVLKKREERTQNAQLTAQLGRTFTSTQHKLECADSLAWMQGAAPDQFNIILTDPPYGMGADKFGDSGLDSAGAHFYEDSYEVWCSIMQVFCGESYRLAAPSAHAYVFCDFDRFPELRHRMQEAGWKVFRTPLIWSNPDGYRAPWPDKGPQRAYECVLFAVKGERNVTQMKRDVLEYRKDSQVGHPAQKPVALLIDLLRRSAKPGDRVFDPFMGSGSTVMACQELKLPCTGLEKDEAAFGIAAKRIAAEADIEKELFDEPV